MERETGLCSLLLKTLVGGTFLLKCLSVKSFKYYMLLRLFCAITRNQGAFVENVHIQVPLKIFLCGNIVQQRICYNLKLCILIIKITSGPVR